MVRAIKRPNFNLKAKLSTGVSSRLPRLPDPSEPDVFEEMTLLQHMEELRDRIVKICIAVGVSFIGGFLLSQPLLRQISAKAAVGPFDPKSPIDGIAIFTKIALYIAVSVAMPIILYQLFGFLAPGLTKKEKRILFTSLPFVVMLFLAGASYAFFQAAPRALEFLKGFNVWLGMSWDLDANETISFFLTLIIGLGLAFQLPVIMFLLAKLRIVTPQKMHSFRRYAILVIIVVSAVITPTTDPISLAMVAVPLYILYELGILTSYLFARPSKPSAPAAA